MVLKLPTTTKLDEGYMFGQDIQYKLSLSTIQGPPGSLTNQWIINTDHSHEVYELLVAEAYTNLSGLTLRPTSYKNICEDVEEIRFDGALERSLWKK